jgi:hypothetical protein
MGLDRLEARDRRDALETFPAQLEQLAVEHSLRPLALVRASPAREVYVSLDGSGPAAVSEIIRLARVGAYAEAQARAFPHQQIRTVVRDAPGSRA